MNISNEHAEFLGKIAVDYYLNKMKLNDITEKYQISRYHLGKYLDEALENGIVEINIHSGSARNFDLELQFKQYFGIKHIFIIKKPLQQNLQNSSVPSFAANYIQEIINQSKIVGVAFGKTLSQTIAHFDSQIRNDLIFTQFMGENPIHTRDNSMFLVQRLADLYNAQASPMLAPLYVADDATRAGLKMVPGIFEALSNSKECDVILSGIGTADSIINLPQTEEIFPNINLNQVAGVLYGRPYDINGKFLNSILDKTLSYPLTKILDVKRRFGVAEGINKAPAILGALNGNLFTDLVIDETLALQVLDLKKRALD